MYTRRAGSGLLLHGNSTRVRTQPLAVVVFGELVSSAPDPAMKTYAFYAYTFNGCQLTLYT